MKIRFLTIGFVLMVGLVSVSACQRGESQEDGDKSDSATASPTFGLATHVFEGKGGNGSVVNSKSAKLHGRYSVKWKVTGNEKEGDGGGGKFFAEIKGDSEDSPSPGVVNEHIADGVGETTISIDTPGNYHASVVSQPGSHWTLKLSRV